MDGHLLNAVDVFHPVVFAITQALPKYCPDFVSVEPHKVWERRFEPLKQGVRQYRSTGAR